MPPDRKLLQLASRIHGVLSYTPRSDPSRLLSAIGSTVERAFDLRRHGQQLAKCLAHGLDAAAARICARVPAELRRLRFEFEQCAVLADEPPGPVPSLRDLYADLRQLADEFGDVQLDGDTLRVVTDPVALEDEPLGRFEIGLKLDKLDEAVTSRALDVDALDPHPAASNSDVTHPHVDGGSLCLGDATTAFTAALHDRRLCDAFLLVRSVLTTYNPGSAYVSLDRWYGTPCTACGYCDGNASWCHDCESDFCDECVNSCTACSGTICHECTYTCSNCNEPNCKECIGVCSVCSESCCSGCLEDEVCPACRASEEEFDEQATQQPDEVTPGANAPTHPEPATACA